MPIFPNLGEQRPVVGKPCSCNGKNFVRIQPAKRLADYLAGVKFNPNVYRVCYGPESNSRAVPEHMWSPITVRKLFELFDTKVPLHIRHVNGKILYHSEPLKPRGETGCISVWIPSSHPTCTLRVCFGSQFALALDYLYSGERTTHPKDAHFVCKSIHLHSASHRFRVIRPLVTALQEDLEYNRLAGIAEPVPQPEYDPTIKRYVPRPVNKNLYFTFKFYMRQWLKNPSVKNWRRFSGSPYVGTHEALVGEQHILFSRKNELDFELCLELAKKNGYPRFVQQIPRFGKVRSDGSTRVIYPPNILYEVASRSRTQGREVPFKGQRMSGFQYPLIAGGYETYDIVHCDEQIMPYVTKFVSETGERVLLPLILDPNTLKLHHGHAFPSGVYHTSAVTEIFTACVALHLTQGPFYLQGDTIVLPHLVSTNDTGIHLRHEGRGKINGFKIHGDRWIYTRGRDRLTTPQWLTRSGTSGANKWHIRRFTYALLGDRDLPAYRSCSLVHSTGSLFGPASCKQCRVLIDRTGLHLYDLDVDTFSKLVTQVYSFNDLPRLLQLWLTDVKGYNCPANIRENSWGAAPYKVEENVRATIPRDMITWAV